MNCETTTRPPKRGKSIRRYRGSPLEGAAHSLRSLRVVSHGSRRARLELAVLIGLRDTDE